jgi:NarL family two-component system sensor histidine kinase LiaS
MPRNTYSPSIARPADAHSRKRTATPFPDESPFEGSALLDGVARQVVGDLNHFFSKERLEQVAVRQERARVAHEIHDGVLQALAGAVLQLETLARTLEPDQKTTLERVRAVQTLLSGEQRELRRWIENLAPDTGKSAASADDLAVALRGLAGNAEAMWGIPVELDVGRTGRVPRTLGDHVYRIVQEGLTNIGRHAHARRACVSVQIMQDSVDIAMSDDGIGFPFHGTYDLAALTAGSVGPRSLKERVASLHGDIVMSTGTMGTRIEISLPMRRFAWTGRDAPRAAHYGHD